MSDQNVGNVVFIRHFMSKIRSKNVGNVVIFDIFGQNFAQKMSEMSYFSTFCSIARVVGGKNVVNDVIFHIWGRIFTWSNISNVVLFDI